MASAIVDSFGRRSGSVACSGDCHLTSGSGDTGSVLADLRRGTPTLDVGDGSDWAPQGLGYLTLPPTSR